MRGLDPKDIDQLLCVKGMVTHFLLVTRFLDPQQVRVVSLCCVLLFLRVWISSLFCATGASPEFVVAHPCFSFLITCASPKIFNGGTFIFMY